MFKNAEEIRQAVDAGITVLVSMPRKCLSEVTPEVRKIDGQYYIAHFRERIKNKKYVFEMFETEPLVKEDGKTLNGEIWNFFSSDENALESCDLNRLKIAVDEVNFLRKKIFELTGSIPQSYLN